MAEPDQQQAAVAADPRFRVLARKYRPVTFAQLIGQEALVRTLHNGFRAGRIAHAYMLAGVRGVGKTTTARIIARALNCTGPDGSGGITIMPCGICEHCKAIAEDRHLDVIEMDAASHTGVDNIRELLDGVPYRPALARYKVYIIDEVHMLSEKAFNALLKTLEEPPEHVKFVFATTEIRKVPITVLSRCQRFDLRRVDAATLMQHLRGIAEREAVPIADGALQLLARAADGSVRDSLSLLDQAIAHGAGRVEVATVRDMLGLVDREVCFDLLEAALQGDGAAALGLLEAQYRAGGDPLAVLEDLLELTHWITRLKLTPAVADAADVPEAERVRGRSLAERLGMADVTRAWQLLLKGLGEARFAPTPLHAVEMVLIRLAYAARLPSPAEALEALAGRSSPPPAPQRPRIDASPRPALGPGIGAPMASGPRTQSTPAAGPALVPQGAPPEAALHEAPVAAGPRPAPAEADAAARLRSFEEVVDLARAQHEATLYVQLLADVHLVRFEPGRIELRLAEQATPDLPQRLSRFLGETTGVRWLVTVSNQPGQPTLREQRAAREAAQIEELSRHPLVRAVLDAFPGATIERVGETAAAVPGADDGAVEDD